MSKVLIRRTARRMHMVTATGAIAAATTTLTALMAALVAFVVNILMARHLGPSSRGEVAWALQWAYVVGPLFALGVDRGALRGLKGTGESLSQSHIWVLAAACAVVAAYFRSFPALVTIAAASSGASVAIERGIGMAKRNLRRFARIQVAIQSWILLASVTLYLSNLNDEKLWLAVYAAPAPILFALSVSRKHVRAGHTTRRPFRPVSLNSIQYMFGGVSTLLAARVERLLLPVLASSRELGLYVSIATATEMVVWGARGLGESRVSSYVRLDLTRKALCRSVSRDLLIFSLVAIPLAGGIRLILIPLLGPEFESAERLVIPLCISSVFWASYLQISAAWLARGRAHQSLLMDLSTALTTAGLVIILVPLYGALGAALACMAAYVLMTIVAVMLLPQPSHTLIDARE